MPGESFVAEHRDSTATANSEAIEMALPRGNFHLAGASVNVVGPGAGPLEAVLSIRIKGRDVILGSGTIRSSSLFDFQDTLYWTGWMRLTGERMSIRVNVRNDSGATVNWLVKALVVPI